MGRVVRQFCKDEVQEMQVVKRGQLDTRGEETRGKGRDTCLYTVYAVQPENWKSLQRRADSIMSTYDIHLLLIIIHMNHVGELDTSATPCPALG